MGKNSDINQGGSVTGLRVYLHTDGEFIALQGVDFTGMVYGPNSKKIKMEKNVDFHGLAITGGELELKEGVSITYIVGDQAAVGSISTCIATSVLPDPIANYYMDKTSWSGIAGEVVDQSVNDYDATAGGGATTAGASPALAGDPGTCRYGFFDGSDDYVELPAGFPNLQGSFTITAWVLADVVTGDQRILADDENNTGGFAFSLGDGDNGKLRFFSRGVNPAVVDTQNVVINTGQWHFVAAVHDASAKTHRIYVDGSFVALSTGGTSSTYTGSLGHRQRAGQHRG